MALNTYANLQTEIASWLRRADLASEIPTFITLAEAQMNRRLKSTQMLARTTLSITGALVAAPTDMVGVRSLRITSSSPPQTLEWVSDEQMDALLDSLDYTSGQPTHYTVEGSSFRFSPDPGTGVYTAALSYYQRLPALSNANPTNWLLTNHPDAYLYGALLQSAPYLKTDERLATWGQVFAQILSDINDSDTGLGGRLALLPQTLYAGVV